MMNEGEEERAVRLGNRGNYEAIRRKMLERSGVGIHKGLSW